MSRLFPDPDPGENLADLASEGHVGAELSARAFRGTQAQGEAGEAPGPFLCDCGPVGEDEP